MQYLLFYKRKKDLSRCAGMERIMQMDMDVNIVIYQKHRWVRTDLQLLLARRRDIMPIKRARVFSVQWWLSNIEYSDCSTRTCILGTYNTFMDCERTIGTGIDINTIGIHINKYVSKVCARPRHILFVLQINLHHGSWIYSMLSDEYILADIYQQQALDFTTPETRRPIPPFLLFIAIIIMTKQFLCV
jgi:hypothetical protein